MPLSALTDLARFIHTHPLTRRAPLAAWRRVAIWQLRSRISPGEIVMPWIGGQRLAVRRGMTGATGNLYAGLHECHDMAFLLHLLRPDDLFLDIGANVGSYTVLASGICGATTWAFEPDQATARDLARNIAVNGLESRVVVHQVALGAEAGEVAFSSGGDTTNHVVTAPVPGTRMVTQRRLDDVVGTARPLLAKIDVERYEEQVLAGSRQLLTGGSLAAIAVETVTPASAALLAEAGFQRAYYDAFGRTLSRTPLAERSANALFVRDWQLVASRIAAAPRRRILGSEI